MGNEERDWRWHGGGLSRWKGDDQGRVAAARELQKERQPLVIDKDDDARQSKPATYLGGCILSGVKPGMSKRGKVFALVCVLKVAFWSPSISAQWSSGMIRASGFHPDLKTNHVRGLGFDPRLSPSFLTLPLSLPTQINVCFCFLMATGVYVVALVPHLRVRWTNEL